MSLEAAESGSNSGLALLELGRYDEALERFEQVLLYTRSDRHLCIACGASGKLLVLHASRKLAASLPPSLSLSPPPSLSISLSLHPPPSLSLSPSLSPSIDLFLPPALSLLVLPATFMFLSPTSLFFPNGLRSWAGIRNV